MGRTVDHELFFPGYFLVFLFHRSRERERERERERGRERLALLCTLFEIWNEWGKRIGNATRGLGWIPANKPTRRAENFYYCCHY